MPDLLATLEQRVGAAVGLIEQLRERLAALERELEVINTTPQSPAASHEEEMSLLREEIGRLRRERHEAREGVRALIREFDRISG